MYDGLSTVSLRLPLPSHIKRTVPPTLSSSAAVHILAPVSPLKSEGPRVCVANFSTGIFLRRRPSAGVPTRMVVMQVTSTTVCDQPPTPLSTIQEIVEGDRKFENIKGPAVLTPEDTTTRGPMISHAARDTRYSCS